MNNNHVIKKTSVFLSVITILALANACRKDYHAERTDCNGNCFIFVGRIIDTPSQNALSDVELNFSYRPPNANLLNSYVDLGTKKTDKDGGFKFQLDGDKYKVGSIYVTALKDGYHFSPLDVGKPQFVLAYTLNNIQPDTPIVANVELFKTATLRLHIQSQNIPDFNNLDIYYGGLSNPPKGYLGKNFIGLGIHTGQTKTDTTINVYIPGDLKSYIKWEENTNGVSNGFYKTDSVFAKAGEITLYDIHL